MPAFRTAFILFSIFYPPATKASIEIFSVHAIGTIFATCSCSTLKNLLNSSFWFVLLLPTPSSLSNALNYHLLIFLLRLSPAPFWRVFYGICQQISQYLTNLRVVLKKFWVLQKKLTKKFCSKVYNKFSEKVLQIK